MIVGRGDFTVAVGPFAGEAAAVEAAKHAEAEREGEWEAVELDLPDASVDAPTRKAELEWEEDSDGDYKHYRAYAADEAFHPYYWLCASAANPKLYGVSIVDEDDDLIIIDERTSPVTLAQAMQIAEAHHRKANS